MGVNFDLAPDRPRLVVALPADDLEPKETRNHMTVVVNFPEEVRRRLAGGAK
jgi:hypothetical protein